MWGLSNLTETVSAESVVISTESSMTEKLVERTNMVFKAVVDPDLIKIACEKFKKQLFAKFAFYWFQPKIDDIHFVSLEEYYEPYILIRGKHFIDYLRKRTYKFKVPRGVTEAILGPNKYVPVTSKSKRIVKLDVEERLTKEERAFLILDKNGLDCTAEDMPSLPSVPPEENPEKAIKELGVKELAENADVNFAKERIVKRPKDITRIVKEILEVTERTVIYFPRYKLLFRWVKTGEEKILVLDAITAKRVRH
jgi:hypothetical protein